MMQVTSCHEDGVAMMTCQLGRLVATTLTVALLVVSSPAVSQLAALCDKLPWWPSCHRAIE